VAVDVAPSEVTGAQPLPGEGLRRQVGFAEVLAHDDGIATDLDLPHLAVGPLDPVLVGDPRLAVGQRAAQRAVPVVGQLVAQNGVGFGQAVPLDNRNPEAPLEGSCHRAARSSA
jgi:hypothetical protein